VHARLGLIDSFDSILAILVGSQEALEKAVTRRFSAHLSVFGSSNPPKRTKQSNTARTMLHATLLY